MNSVGRGKFGGKNRKRKEKKRKEKKKMREKLQLISRFHGDRVVGSYRSKRQSWSMQQELRVGTKISGFRQASRGSSFYPTRFNSCLRAVQMDGCLGPERPCISVLKI